MPTQLHLQLADVVAGMEYTTGSDGKTVSHVVIKLASSGKILQRVGILYLPEPIWNHYNAPYAVHIPETSDLFGNDENIALEVHASDLASGKAYPPYVCGMCMVTHPRNFEAAYLAVVRRFRDPEIRVPKVILNYPQALWEKHRLGKSP